MPSDPIDSVAPPAAWRASSIHSSYLRIAFALAEKMGLHTDALAPTQARLLPFLDILPLLDVLDVKRRPQLGAALGDLIPAAAQDRKSTRLNSSHPLKSRMPSSA